MVCLLSPSSAPCRGTEGGGGASEDREGKRRAAMLPTWDETLHEEAGIIHPTPGQLIHHPP